MTAARHIPVMAREVADALNLRDGGRYLDGTFGAGGYSRAANRQTVAALAQAEANLQAVEEDIALRVQREYQGVAEGVLRIRAGARAAESAERLVASSRRAFEGGVRTRVDILNAEDKRQTALRDLAQARYDYLKATVRLSALAGQDCSLTLQTLNAWLVLPPAGGNP